MLFPLLFQEIDLRIGASFTRFQTLLLQNLFLFPAQREDQKQVLSFGPCQVFLGSYGDHSGEAPRDTLPPPPSSQFPTLGFVVERFWQIKAHVHEDFWTIICRFVNPKDRVSAEFSWL